MGDRAVHFCLFLKLPVYIKIYESFLQFTFAMVKTKCPDLPLSRMSRTGPLSSARQCREKGETYRLSCVCLNPSVRLTPIWFCHLQVQLDKNDVFLSQTNVVTPPPPLPQHTHTTTFSLVEYFFIFSASWKKLYESIGPFEQCALQPLQPIPQELSRRITLVIFYIMFTLVLSCMCFPR